MIDVDQGHGNTNETLRLIERYNECRLKLEGVPTIFKTEIKHPDVLPSFKVTPLEGIGNTSVNAIAGSNTNDRSLAKIILTKDEASEIVDTGFYGNLTLGNVFYNYAVHNKTDGPLYALLKRISDDAKSGNTVKVFICGSLFGGTGASGMSFICQRLIEMVGESDRANLHIHAGMMLPYFKPDYSDAEAIKDENGDKIKQKIRHENFKRNAEAALQKYEKMVNVFDAVVMVGDHELPVRGAYSEEGRNQKNWPHVLEISVAAEAGKFFDAPDSELGNADNTRWYANPFDLDDQVGKIREYHIERLQWRDFRVKGKAEFDERLRKSIEDFLLLNYYYSMYIVPTLFDLAGGSLVSWDIDADDDDDTFERKQDLPDWAKHRFIELSKVLKKIERWFNNIAIPEFTSLFKYFTESAQWYYALAFDYGSVKERPCWETGASPACAGNPDRCERHRESLLPRLFQGRRADTLGLKLLLNRACIHKCKLHYWLDCSADIHEMFGIEDPVLDDISYSKRMGDDDGTTQMRMFVDIVADAYKRISETTAGR